MERYLKRQLIMSKLTHILIKSGLAGFGTYSSISFDPSKISYFIFGFNALYMLCSIFQFCLNVTGNYIIATVSFIGIFWVITSNMVKVPDIISIVLILGIFLFFVSDIIGLIKIMRIPID
ncbi:MAG: hypothetical protein R3Y29_05210 [bacterium]